MKLRITKHRSHQNTVRRWCRIDRHLDRDVRLIASKLRIEYKEA